MVKNTLLSSIFSKNIKIEDALKSLQLSLSQVVMVLVLYIVLQDLERKTFMLA